MILIFYHCMVGTSNISYLLVTVISFEIFFFIGSINPIQALNKEETNLQHYNNLKQLVDDIKNGVLNEDKIPFNDFKNSGAYQNADKNMQDCINLAAKIGHNLGDNEIVHCSENVNYFKDKYPGISRLETNASMNVPETNASMNVPETNASMNVPETNASMNVPETNASMNVPETNASMNVPETNASM